MVRGIAKEMKLYITKSLEGVLQLDVSPIDVLGVLKYVHMYLNKFSKIMVPQYIVVVDFPPLFGICLSREFIAKLGGYLDLYYTHLDIPFYNKRF